MTVSKFRDKWRAEVYLNGKRIASKSGFDKERDAKRWHDEQLVGYRNGDLKEQSKVKFDQVLDHYVTYHLPTIKPRSQDRYKLEIESRIRPFFRYLRLDQVTPLLLEQFKLETANDYNELTANYCLETLRAILNRAKKWRMTKESLFCVELFPEIPKDYVWWDDKGHITRFLEAAKERTKHYPAYLTALETGMRIGEIMGLGKGDIDLEHGRIHVQRQWHDALKDYGSLKNNKTRWLDFDPRSHLGQVLKKARDTSRYDKILFPSSAGTPLSYTAFGQETFYSVQERAGVPLISFHDLRHTFASWYMIEMDDLWALMAILGHSDSQMTQKYAHLSPKHRRAPLDMSSLLITHKSRTNLKLVAGSDCN